MKRFLTFIFTLSLIMNVFSENANFSKWSFTAEYGLNLVFGDYIPEVSKPIPPTYGLALESALTPTWGLSFDFYYFPYKGENSTKTALFVANLMNSDFNATINFTKMIFPNTQSKFSVNGCIGLGVADYKSKFTQPTPIGGLKYAIIDSVTPSKYAASIPNPNYVTPPTLNADKEKRTARLQRAAKWADALAIFGAGIGGRTINPDTLAAPSIQKARDEEFQNYKNISEANKQTANNWENNYHKQMMDWVDDQLKSNQLKESERQKYQELRDQLANQKTISDDANSTHVKTTGMNNDTALKIAAMENSLKKAEEEDKFGSPNITYQAANGQTINRVIPKPEQRDIISRAKTNPEFKKYIQTALHQTYKNVIGEDGEPKTIVVDELGKEVTDQNLLQAYLRWETTGAPNKTWPEVQSPGQVIEPDNQNTPVQQQTPQSKNDPLNLGL